VESSLIHKVFNFIAQEENQNLYDTIEKIKRGTESFKPSLLLPYDDLSGNPTYAYGIETNRYGKKNTISEMEMQFTKIIQEDALKPVENINTKYNLKLNDNQKTSLASLIYNIGETRFKESNAYKYLIDNNLEDFKYEAFNSEQGFVKSKGKKLKGLVNRRQKEKELFESVPQEMQIEVKEKPIKQQTLPTPKIDVSFGSNIVRPDDPSITLNKEEELY